MTADGSPEHAQGPERPIDVTVVLPAYNESESVRGSYGEIAGVMGPTGLDYEILFVDDGSRDGTWAAIRDLARQDPRVRALRHRGNAGKASALANAFTYARGEIVAICDADMQYDPADLVRVIDKLFEGYDAVSANKIVRRDPLSRRLPSKFFNFFVRSMTGVQLHDMNAGLKAFRRDAANELVRFGYGELHRFFVVILASKGYSVAEVPVESRPRVSGRSKYGIERYLRGALDFLTVFFLSGYVERPMHLFGGLGVALGFVGTALLVYELAVTLAGASGSVIAVQAAALLVLSGVQLFVTGLVAEMINNLDRGAISRSKIAEVVGIERRSAVTGAPGVALERRGPRPAGPLFTRETVLADVALRELATGVCEGPGGGTAERQAACGLSEDGR